MHEPLDERTLDQYSPLLLAYVGDAVYELMVRTRMVAAGQRPVREIHLDAVQKVKAEHQARVIKTFSASCRQPNRISSGGGVMPRALRQRMQICRNTVSALVSRH